MSLDSYLAKFRQALGKFENFGLSQFIDFQQEIRPGKQAIVNVKVILINNTFLYIKAYINARYRVEILSYSFQYQKKNGQLIFRYDNAEHRPSLPSKEHKHKSDGSVIEATIPDIYDLVDEIIELF